MLPHCVSQGQRNVCCLTPYRAIGPMLTPVLQLYKFLPELWFLAAETVLRSWLLKPETVSATNISLTYKQVYVVSLHTYIILQLQMCFKIYVLIFFYKILPQLQQSTSFFILHSRSAVGLIKFSDWQRPRSSNGTPKPHSFWQILGPHFFTLTTDFAMKCWNFYVLRHAKKSCDEWLDKVRICAWSTWSIVDSDSPRICGLVVDRRFSNFTYRYLCSPTSARMERRDRCKWRQKDGRASISRDGEPYTVLSSHTLSKLCSRIPSS